MGKSIILGYKLLGTFQEELATCLQCTESLGPYKLEPLSRIQFNANLWFLIKDAWRASKWEDKFKICWRCHLGWRPADWRKNIRWERLRMSITSKNKPFTFSDLMRWSVFQFWCLVVYVFYMFGNIALSYPRNFYYGAFVFFDCLCNIPNWWTKNSKSWIWKVLKSIAGWQLF